MVKGVTANAEKLLINLISSRIPIVLFINKIDRFMLELLKSEAEIFQVIETSDFLKK